MAISFFEDNNLEDATFSTYIEITDDEIEKIEDKYNITFEKNTLLILMRMTIRSGLFKANKKIDLYEVVDGRDVSRIMR